MFLCNKQAYGDSRIDTMQLKILIIAVHHDPHTQAVCWGLRTLGHEPVLWYWNEFPKNDSAGLRIGAQQRPEFKLTLSNALHTESFDVIWVRRRGTPMPMPDGHPDDTPIVISESGKYFENLLPYLGHTATRWINRLDLTPYSLSKAHQLIVARNLGFRIPDTLVGNDPQQVREFFAQHRGQIIHKPFTQVQWENEDGSHTIGKTSALSSEHIASDFAMRACPGIYQELIEKKYELRVTVMGNIAIAAAIYSQQDGRTIDWRCEGGRGQTNLKAMTLAPELNEQCIALCRALKLDFGCIDLIITDDDGAVFLEVNSSGQFLFKENADPTIPMLDTFCRFLIHDDNVQQIPDLPRLTLPNYFASDEARIAKQAHAEYLQSQQTGKSRIN